MGWFFGFKLHLIINEKGEILNFTFSPGDVDDRAPLKMENFVKVIFGKLAGVKVYLRKRDVIESVNDELKNIAQI